MAEMIQKTEAATWCSVRKGALRNFAKFTGKHLCQRLFFKISKNIFFTEHLGTTASEKKKCRGILTLI